MITLLRIFLLGFLITSINNATAQVDTISLASKDLITAHLKPGLRQYLVYFELPKKKKVTGHSLWSREVSMQERDGRKTIQIEQQWTSHDTTYFRSVYSLVDASTFVPIYHYTRSPRGIEAFNFNTDRIAGADSVAGNSQAAFDLALTTPTLNWELDLETFSLLPYRKAGQRFIINFYHPGSKTAPKFYEYKVIGEEKLSTHEGDIACWMLKIDYNETDWAIFWIAKRSRVVLKMKEHFRGNYRYKVLLSTSTPTLSVGAP